MNQPGHGRIIVYAPRVASRGGVVLLALVTAELQRRGKRALVIAKGTLRAELHLAGGVEFVDASTLTPRPLGPERYLRRVAGKGDTVICFGNLPPLFRLRAFTTVFLQNRNILPSAGFWRLRPWRMTLKDRVQAALLRRLRKHADRFIVQSQSMQRELAAVLNDDNAVKVVPFAAQPAVDQSKGGTPSLDFIYVATGDWHKNHRTLIEAWVLLAGRGVRPGLVLTLDPTDDAALIAWIAGQTQAHQLGVTILGRLPHTQVLTAYRSARALIFPSLSESFGLPLVEASQAGVPILASELDYVRDVVEPVETFDPRSPLSIMRAVLRFLGRPAPRDEIAGADRFLDSCGL